MTGSRRSWVRFLGLVVLAMLVILAYTACAHFTAGLGFPLDDAWIHQTYARNLGQGGEWAFVPGEPSGGSTAPLWTAILAIGYALGVDARGWAWAWGAVLLALVAWASGKWIEARAPATHGAPWLLAVLMIVEWHLAWAGASGMETLAQALVVVLVLWAGERRWAPAVQGLLIGVGVWVRPDALLLLLPAAWSIIFAPRPSVRSGLQGVLALAVGLAILAVPYLAFNLHFSGEIWPSTFYAKQAEYAALLEQPLALRLVQQWGSGLVGAGVMLAPGVALAVVRDVARRRWARLAPIVWWLTFLAVYAARLPVTYQHGRYAMAAIPVFLVLGWEGLRGTIRPEARRLAWVLPRAWAAATSAVALAFLVLGARAYGRDVGVINTEMVAAARWVAAHTPPGSLIAAHDIGALGYFGQRRLLDLAGLITPQVIPFLRDEARLAAYLDVRRADFLMTFPGWYPRLTAGREPVYRSSAGISPSLGGENMAVYEWQAAGAPP
jgi:hypothetical protein